METVFPYTERKLGAGENHDATVRSHFADRIEPLWPDTIIVCERAYRDLLGLELPNILLGHQAATLFCQKISTVRGGESINPGSVQMEIHPPPNRTCGHGFCQFAIT